MRLRVQDLPMSLNTQLYDLGQVTKFLSSKVISVITLGIKCPSFMEFGGLEVKLNDSPF